MKTSTSTRIVTRLVRVNLLCARICVDDVWQSTIDFVRDFLGICFDDCLNFCCCFFCVLNYFNKAYCWLYYMLNTRSSNICTAAVGRMDETKNYEPTSDIYIWRICVCVSKQIIVWFEATIVCKAVNLILAIRRNWMKTTYVHILKPINHVFMRSFSLFFTCTHSIAQKPKRKTHAHKNYKLYGNFFRTGTCRTLICLYVIWLVFFLFEIFYTHVVTTDIHCKRLWGKWNIWKLEENNNNKCT